jgi:hypothetical protein
MKLAAALLSLFVLPVAEASDLAPSGLADAVQQLRQAAGRWNVTTTRYAENGAVAAVATGTWSFEWVVPDRVLSGRSAIPDWNQSAGMLFYLNERLVTLEMAEVNADGQLVVMSGPVGKPARTADAVTLSDGRRVMQRHTRFDVTPDRFEARLETSYDGGQSWRPGYHQVFVRAPAKQPGSAVRMQHRTRPQPYVPLT